MKQSGRDVYRLHAEVCKTLANPKRIEVIDLLRCGERPVNELASEMRIRKANLSQHLAIMRAKRIVEARRRGVNVYYRLTDMRVVKACDIMRQVLIGQLRRDAKLAGGLR